MARRKMKRLRERCTAIEATLSAQIDTLADQGNPSATEWFYEFS
jgi:hypothetical protein